MNAPTPVMSSVPSLAATNSGPVPMRTPPLTPAHRQGSATSANNGRKESESEREDAAPGTKKRDVQSIPDVEEGRASKKRRVVPTPVDLAAESGDLDASTGEDTTMVDTRAQQ